MSLATPESLLTASASSLVPGDRAKVVDEMRMKKVEKDKECRVVRREFDLINAKKIKAVDISDFMCAM